jgi:hypothetical protein
MAIRLHHGEATLNLWECAEIELHSKRSYGNPYTEVTVWIDLNGPGFRKRIYGFWDGDGTWKVRLTVTAPGEWTWESATDPFDPDLAGVGGSITATRWGPEDLEDNPLRRGFIQPTPNGHAFQYADGTPVYLLGDTWWATATFRYPWHDDEEARPLGPGAGFKDMVAYRRRQGYNCIAMLAGFPTWANDGNPNRWPMPGNDEYCLRWAWPQGQSGSAKDMHNEGGRPFHFPGRVPGFETVVPDYDRPNPDYFRFLDRKIDYLNQEGFVPFIEVARRDIIGLWRAHYDWPRSYTRFAQYVFARYQAHNCLLSPIHYDAALYSIPSRDYNEPANLLIDTYGPPPFGTLLGTNSNPSSLVNFGGPTEARWLTFHQIGNRREHEYYWYLTEIHRTQPPRPALNGEPFYPGFDGKPADSEEAEANCRSGMYGSFLSGGLAGFFYGVQGVWGADIEPDAEYHLWDSLQYRSGAQVGYLREFVMAEGERYVELVPEMELVVPSKSGPPEGYRGWTYCAATPERDLFMLYFEPGCPPSAKLRGCLPDASYTARWFDPRSGGWIEANAPLASDERATLALPCRPDQSDWGLVVRLVTDATRRSAG